MLGQWIFAGTGIEDDIDTQKSGVSARPSLCSLCCTRVETGVGNRNLFSKRKKHDWGDLGMGGAGQGAETQAHY